MIHKSLSPTPGLVHVVFELPASIWADRIYLVGDFNDWQTNVTPFVQGRDGVWRVALELPCNQKFEFRYLIDGNWQTDYHADGWSSNRFGSQNSIVDTQMHESKDFAEQSSLIHEELVEKRRRAAIKREESLSPLMSMVKDYTRSRSRAG